MAGAVQLVTVGSPAWQTPIVIENLARYKILELALASTVGGVVPEMVTILNLTHTNKYTVADEHYLRRSDPKIRADFLVMVYGAAAQASAIDMLMAVSESAFSWQMTRSMEETGMPQLCPIAVMGMVDVRRSEPPVTPIEIPEATQGTVKKTSQAIHSSLPCLLGLSFAFVVVWLRL